MPPPSPPPPRPTTTTRLLPSTTPGWSILPLMPEQRVIISNPNISINMRILRGGCIHVLGAILYPSSNIYTIGPAAPTSSLITIKAATSSTTTTSCYIESSFEPAYPVVIALSITNDSNIILPHANEEEKEHHLNTFIIPLQWEHAMDGIIRGVLDNNKKKKSKGASFKVMVIGNKGVGKSSFIRATTNRYISSTSSGHSDSIIRVLDLDCGQPDTALPGTISINKLDKVCLYPGPSSVIISQNPTNNNNHHHNELFTGGTTPSLHPRDYILKCCRLIDEALNKRDNKDDNTPIIVNTPGWYGGLGGHMLAYLRYYMKPDMVIIIGNPPLEHYWYDLCSGNNPIMPPPPSTQLLPSSSTTSSPLLLPPGKDVIISPVTASSTDHHHHHDDSTVITTTSPKPADLRWLRYACYFRPDMCGNTKLWHTMLPQQCFQQQHSKLIHIPRTSTLNSIYVIARAQMIDDIRICEGMMVGLLDCEGWLLCQGVVKGTSSSTLDNGVIDIWVPNGSSINGDDVYMIVRGNITWSPRESAYYTNPSSNTRLCCMIPYHKYFLPYSLKREPTARGSNPRTNLKRIRLLHNSLTT